MKFLIASDIHDEFLHEMDSYIKTQLKYSQADVLLLAGDIVTPQTKHRLKCLGIPTYMVCGNHELYDTSWDNGVTEYQDYFKDSNVHVLENDSINIPGTNIRLISATLWTDFWAPASVGKEYHGGNCMRGMNDFALIKGLIDPIQWKERHRRLLHFIKKELSEKHGGPTIVMTHHSPSFKSNHPAYINSPISGGFCSDLEYIIEQYQPDIWIHGHTHDSWDYKIGKTRVICNPRGYVHEINPNFNPDLIIES